MEALEILRGMQQERVRLTPGQAAAMTSTHRRTILKGFKYDLTDPDEYLAHSTLVARMGRDYMLREFSDFVIDEHNRDVLRFLTYYFNGCPLAEQVFPGAGYKLHKNIMLVGEPGTGKTLIMQVFADYLRATRNDNQFRNISVTQLMNCQKVNGHIDRYTFNEAGARDGFEGAPFNVCLNDLGIKTENQKSYGTLLTQVTDEFLFARYEIYQQQGKRFHITSNLSVRDLKQRFEARIVDRFKSFNVLELRGPSRRK